MGSRSLLLAALLLVSAGPATGREPSVSYEVTIDSPAGVATGSVVVRARVSGGVRDAREAAFHVRSFGPWSEDQRIPMTRVSDAVFEATWDTTAWENDSYRLEVRARGDVPPYDPSDPRTFARAVTDVAVDNPPPAPERIEGVSAAATVRIGWTAVPTADRPDFEGYRVLARKGATCPAEASAYPVVADVDQLLYVDGRTAPGRYCFRVASLRYSVLTGILQSPPSAPLRIRVGRAAGGGVGIVVGEAPKPPPAPVLGEGTVEVSDGAFSGDLPYDPRTVTEAQRREDEAAAAGREAGADPARTPTLVAFGLVLAVGALLIRRFLATGALPR